jgi:hypothetical protein
LSASSKTIASNPDFKRDSARSSSPGQRIAVFGFVLYAAFAPHSIAGAEISLAIVGVGWLLRTLTTRDLRLHRTRLDLPIWIFFTWTIASSVLSEEPSISIPKIQSACVLFLFYITQAIVSKRTAIMLVCVMILSGVAGSLYSVYDLLRGRGVVIESMTADSPLLDAHAEVGDAVWRINDRRVYSTTDINEAIKATPPEAKLSVSLISRGEHVERPGIVLNEKNRRSSSPSGITGSSRTHRFRASGWTRHYETFSEILQILALLSLGLALAHLRNHGANARFKLAIAASSILALGIALTAMRTVLVAFVLGGFVIVLRAARGKTRLVVVAALLVVLVAGALVVSQTRAKDALALQDSSVSLRVAVAKAGLSRVRLHPFFGHGMDAVHRHWNEWGFPGDQMIGLHSTPLQLAFDRGLPALLCWIWITATFWLIAARAGRRFQDSSDTNSYGVLLGTIGAIAAFFASSLVNYNFGDAEVALVFWWLMGITVVLSRAREQEHSAGAGSASRRQ